MLAGRLTLPHRLHGRSCCWAQLQAGSLCSLHVVWSLPHQARIAQPRWCDPAGSEQRTRHWAGRHRVPPARLLQVASALAGRSRCKDQAHIGAVDPMPKGAVGHQHVPGVLC